MSRYIDAENAISVLEILADKCADDKVFDQAISVLKDVPTENVVERKVGKWIYCDNSEHWKCNQCGCRAGFWFNEENSSGWEKDMLEWLSAFCPNCGAEMVERKEDD